ncbi:hypothetical protein BaRGS_00028640, partial [Batillaria attramentaria]
ELRQCLRARDTAGILDKCLCADTISLGGREWWQTNFNEGENMPPELYVVLAARFCGPATTIEVPTITTPLRSIRIRTLSDAIAHVGLRMALLTLYPNQVDLINKTGLPRVLLWGPP